MKKNNIIQLNNQKKNHLPTNAIEVKDSDLIRIPIFERIYQVDGELYYQVAGSRVPRKLKDYKLEDFN